jgi:hypothetical protein
MCSRFLNKQFDNDLLCFVVDFGDAFSYIYHEHVGRAKKIFLQQSFLVKLSHHATV